MYRKIVTRAGTAMLLAGTMIAAATLTSCGAAGSRAATQNSGWRSSAGSQGGALFQAAAAAAQKWPSLTADQKNQAYAIQAAVADEQTQLLDVYVTLGVYDQGAADQLKQRIADTQATMKQNGTMPALPVGGGTDGRGTGAAAPSDVSSGGSRRLQPDVGQIWSDLTADQKNQVYDLQQKITDTQSQLLDLFGALGLLDSSAVAQAKQQLSAQFAAAKQSGAMPSVNAGRGGSSSSASQG